jgi:Sap, sulfolipid-1-addressing protein
LTRTVNRDLTIIFFAALVATLNPSLLAAVTAMLLLPRPKRLMLGYLLGAYTTSMVSGVAIVYSLHDSGVAGTATHTLSPGADLAVGAVALATAIVLATGADRALRSRRPRMLRFKRSADRPKGKPWRDRMLGRGSAGLTFLVGAAVSFPGASYANALDHIAHLDPPTISILGLIVFFCLMQQILLEGALLAYVVAADTTQRAVVRGRVWLTSHGRGLGMIGLSGLGLLLAGRGLAGLS